MSSSTVTERIREGGSTSAKAPEGRGRRRAGKAALAAGGVALFVSGLYLGHDAWQQPNRKYDGAGMLLGACVESTQTIAMKNNEQVPLSVGSIVVGGNSGEVLDAVDARLIDGSLLLTGTPDEATEFKVGAERIMSPGSTFDLHQGKQTLTLNLSAADVLTVHKTCG